MSQGATARGRTFYGRSGHQFRDQQRGSGESASLLHIGVWLEDERGPADGLYVRRHRRWRQGYRRRERVRREGVLGADAAAARVEDRIDIARRILLKRRGDAVGRT